MKDFSRIQKIQYTSGSSWSLSAAAKQTLHSEMKGTSSVLIKPDI